MTGDSSRKAIFFIAVDGWFIGRAGQQPKAMGARI